ncbi:hypothetical protein MTO98_19060 [Mucilaginibacter sp. SMC90]|uniref:hypothetical protein n=1 Tax=Mucilaginibacter sp. SMC90 TaxID=2929803 RepID=UPI001FB3495E|nr:hypothetical protein [Mucilaginibacter sp. SMC90]UOE46504.1 hypothetical protein MTO98_19060 [Mucilaginibacter sp. SMC90]
MKKIILTSAIFLAILATSRPASAQISINVNIGSQPAWGPTGYDHVDYYYIPAIDAYYYVPSAQYVYLVNSKWIWSVSLPSRYSGFDLYGAYKVVMNTPKPYLQHQSHITKYSKYKTYTAKQPVIRDSHDTKYTQARNNEGRNQPQRQQSTKQRANNKPENKKDDQHRAPSQKNDGRENKGSDKNRPNSH